MGWGGNPSRLTPVMLLIDLGKPYKLPIGSRTSSLPLVTAVMFCKIYKDCISDHT